MQALKQHTGIVAPMDRPNVDTDAIIPKQFLKSIKRSGFGPNLFDEWRYLDHGEPGMDNSTRPVNPDFVLNQARYQGASVLIARDNFGCGSSREHAPIALAAAGVKAVIAESFARIYYRNSINGGRTIYPLESEENIRDVVRTGDEVEIDMADLSVKNISSGKKFRIKNFGPVKDIIEAGGLTAYNKRSLPKEFQRT